jgi:lactobin A/cerein 7B family class IIb bacteriocin
MLTKPDRSVSAAPQVLTAAEIEQVSGGILPIIAVAALIAAAAVGFAAAKAM